MANDAKYSSSSPYFGTGTFGSFLDVMVDRKITIKNDDVLYKIDQIYNLRPDLLASDLYGNAGLWWVFAKRNPNVLKDPLFDFTAGNSIYLPSKGTLSSDLGV